MRDTFQRKGHAVLDLGSRHLKGQKIERLLGMDLTGTYDLLEVGTGSGGIAHYFSRHSSVRCTVASVDVEDTRLVTDGFAFQKVDSTALPFADQSFDVVLTNHVIEHVGDHLAQAAHLAEIRRVLRPDGIVYLAVPNRWMLIEPHYQLAFLSWLPRRLRSPYLRLAGKGNFFDCEPLEKHELETLVRNAGLIPRNRSVDAFRLTLQIEGDKGWLARSVAKLSDPTLARLRTLMPTHIYTLTRAG